MSDFLQDYFDTLTWWQKVKYRLAAFGEIQFALDASEWLTKQPSVNDTPKETGLTVSEFEAKYPGSKAYPMKQSVKGADQND